jgi:hypothetical protein
MSHARVAPSPADPLKPPFRIRKFVAVTGASNSKLTSLGTTTNPVPVKAAPAFSV